MTNDLILSGKNTIIRLGPELARGGEGAVYTLLDSQEKLLKLYLRPPSEEKLRKLRLMTTGQFSSLTKVAAWPTDLVSDTQGRTLGFVMPRATAATEAHELYTPKSRAQVFPEADFRFLLHVASNIVRAFGVIHNAGLVIGDVNHGQVLVGKDGKVTLIDCDSFQVRANDHLYTCDVGVPLFTAPELQGQPFRGLHRTADHDRFGLAVILFQLLFMGRHPYAGVPLDPNQSTEIEAAIKTNRFAYGSDRRARGVEQPPGTLPLSTYGDRISLLLERAFARPSIASRPDATTWLDALKALQSSLKACATSPAHHYPNHLASCPWCTIEARTGGRLFGQRYTRSGLSEPLDIAALWGAITAIPVPAQRADPVPSLVAPKLTAKARTHVQLRGLRRAASVVGALITFLVVAALNQPILGLVAAAVISWFVWPRVPSVQREAAKRAESEAKTAFAEMYRRWSEAATSQPFSIIRKRCIDAKAELEKLPAERTRRLAALKSEAKQRETFLDGFRIGKEKIPGIGPGRIAALASFGVETAWDVTPIAIQAIPGFGPATATKLLTWRKTKEISFRFNPNHPIALAELNAIEADLGARSLQLAGVLRTGPALLRHASAESTRILTESEPLVKERWVDWQVAKQRYETL